MKAFIAVFLAAAVVAEPDPNMWMASPMLQPLVYAAKPSPFMVSPTEYKTIIDQNQQGKVMTEKMVKEEDKAVEGLRIDTHVQPLMYGHFNPHPFMGYAAHPGFVPAVTSQRVKTFADHSVTKEKYADKGKYMRETPGSVHVAKREAEPEPYLPYAAYAFHPSIYRMPYTSYAYGHAPVYPTSKVQAKFFDGRAYADDRVTSDNYAGKGTIARITAGSVHLAKRDAEAEAEADPYLIYGYNYYNAVPSVYRARTVAATPFIRPYSSPYTYNAYYGYGI